MDCYRGNQEPAFVASAMMASSFEKLKVLRDESTELLLAQMEHALLLRLLGKVCKCGK